MVMFPGGLLICCGILQSSIWALRVSCAYREVRMMLSQKLCCLTFCLAVCASYFCLPVGSAGVVRRSRRSAAATRRVFVVRLSDSGALFTVGSVPPGATDRFQFVDSSPPGLVLDGSTGMISKSSSAQWNAPTEIKFQVTSPGTEYRHVSVIRHCP